jgi:RimJ/RimL family protein N-acetyltransferase
MTHDSTANTVRLRPYNLDDCTITEAHPPTPEDDRFSFFGFPIVGQLRRIVESGEAFPKPGELTGRLAVEAGGEFVGGVSWHPSHYGPIPAPAVNFGIGLFPFGRGKGYGTEAQRLLVEYLFNNTTVNRVEASTDVENLAEQRSLEKIGLQREGIMRGCHFREGRYNDMVLYATIRADFEAARASANARKVTTGFTA